MLVELKYDLCPILPDLHHPDTGFDDCDQLGTANTHPERISADHAVGDRKFDWFFFATDGLQ